MPKMNNEQPTIEVASWTSEKLADIIVSNRYLGLYEDVAIAAMEELAKRRVGGDSFDYEKYIDEKLNELPKIQFKMPQIQANKLFDLLKGIIK
jgi:hypothetical protein